MKVRIKSLGLPKAAYGQQVNYGLSLGSGMQGDSSGSLKPKRTIGGVPREEANLEAEGGETVVGQISGDGIVDHMTIKGPRHSNGGVPMNLPDDSFIFSDTKSMKIKDPQILQMFGKTKGSYTPAELAKPYDISKYKAILMDPDTDRLSRNTAEIMIKNVVMKLGALALAQEAKKGFPQGIPEISKPYMEANGISEEDLIPELKAQAEQMQAMQQQQAMQMQQAQGMQQPQMQQQGMPPMMPDGQPAAMPQQGMVPPEQPMMDPRQMMAMQQEQQMMPPQPQQGMPMADSGIIVDGSVNEPIPVRFPMTEEEAARVQSGQNYKNSMFIKDNRIFNDVFRDSSKEQDRTGLGSPTPTVLSRPTQNFTTSEQLEQLRDYRSPISSVARQEAARLQQSPASAAARTISRVLTRNSYGGTPMAAYGMQLGGYDMPFIMGTGGMMRYDGGGETVTLPDGRVVPSTSVEALTYENRGITTSGGKEAAWEETVTEGKERENVKIARGSGSGSAPSSGWEGAICDMIKAGATWEQLTDPDAAEAATGSRKTHLSPNSAQAKAIWERCKGDQSIFEDKVDVKAHHIEAVENPTEGTCVCADTDGNPFPGHTPMSYEEILASGKIEGYTVEQKCQGFKEAFCTETTTELDPPIRPEKMDLMPLPAEISMSRGVADINPTTLDIVPTGERNYLDYRTAAQNDANAREQQIASIKTMPGVSIGQKQAMIAQVNSQDKSASIVTDVYNKNVATANELAKSDEAQAMRTQALQADLDSNYNQAVANAENQRTLNVNAIRDRRQRRRDDMYKMGVMKTSLENAAENYDWMGNFTGGTEVQQASFMRCVNAGNSPAACAEKYLPNASTTNVATNTTTPPAETPAPEPEPTAGTARYGRIVNPYIMASSVYPFNK